jgi:hypothetical protein
MAQFWVGATDVNFMLLNIGGWHVGSYAAREAAIAVSYAIERGWVQERTHYFPYDGSTGQAYELTDAGLAYVEWAWGLATAARTKRARQWYRDRAPAEKDYKRANCPERITKDVDSAQRSFSYEQTAHLGVTRGDRHDLASDRPDAWPGIVKSAIVLAAFLVGLGVHDSEPCCSGAGS